MKQAFKLLSALLCALLLMGAVRPPVLPAKGLYVSDYAGILFRAHRNLIMDAAMRTRMDTGVDVVLLTVKDTGDLAPADYAAQIAAGWDMGGADKSGYVLLLLRQSDRAVCLRAGERFDGTALAEGEYPAFLQDAMQDYLQEEKLSKAVSEGYKAVVLEVYGALGQEPDAAFAAKLQGGGDPNQAFWTSIAFIGAMLIMLRSFFVSRHYRLKYGKTRVYKRRRITRDIADLEFDIIRQEVLDDEEGSGKAAGKKE